MIQFVCQDLATLRLRGLRILAAILAMLNCRPKGTTDLLCFTVGASASALEAIGDIILSWMEDSLSATSSTSAWDQG